MGIQHLLLNYPLEVAFSDIQEFHRFEERFFELERIFGDIVGMNLGSVEFCPNNEPPDLKSELLPWLWMVNPAMDKEIMLMADEDLKSVMKDYREQTES